MLPVGTGGATELRGCGDRSGDLEEHARCAILWVYSSAATHNVSATADPSIPPVPNRQGAGRLVLSPHEPLTEGGAAEEFEHSIQARIAEGHRHLIVDFSRVGRIDSAGIRALVRGHTTARRRGGSLRLARVNAEVRAVLDQAKLSGVFPMVDSVADAQVR